MPNIIVNGEELQSGSSTVSDLITREKKLIESHVVVEVNGTILKKEFWPLTTLNDSDRVEIIQFVGGGCR